MDNTRANGDYFEIKLNEYGVNVDEVAKMSKSLMRSKASQSNVDSIKEWIKLFQMGPHTGNPVYNEHFATNAVESILESCPTGKVRNVYSVREMRKYPGVSGEFVRIRGFCLKN